MGGQDVSEYPIRVFKRTPISPVHLRLHLRAVCGLYRHGFSRREMGMGG